MRKLHLFWTLCVITFPVFLSAQKYEANWESLNKREIPSWYSDAKFGIFIHWGVYSVPSFCPVGPDGYAEWYWESLIKTNRKTHAETKAFHDKVYGSEFNYFDFAPLFKAEMFNAAHWAEVFKKSGAQYIVPTSKHHEGFCLWPSKEASNSYGRAWNAVETGPKRDLLGEIREAVLKEGLRFGVYYSLMEWNNPYWKENKAKYVDEVMNKQFKEVVNNYRPSLIFTDGEWELPASDWKSTQLLSWLFSDSPVKNEVVVNDRWGQNERGKQVCMYYTSEYGAGLDGSHVWEESRGIGESYGYNRAETASDYKTGSELIVILADVVSRGGNLLLDIGPTADGRIPEIQELRLLEMGQWLKINGEAIYGSKRWKNPSQWHMGKALKLNTGNYQSDYNINQLVMDKKDNSPFIEAFLTSKENTLYVILPNLNSEVFNLMDMGGKIVKEVNLLGVNEKIAWKQKDNSLQINHPVNAMFDTMGGYPKCYKISF
jgi:alpha-L-fucosidase